MDDLRIQIKTDFLIDKTQLQSTLNSIGKNQKLSVNLDIANVAGLKSVTEAMKTLQQEQQKYASGIGSIKNTESEYWKAKRQHAIESMTATNQELVSMREYYTQLEATAQKEAQIAAEKKKAQDASNSQKQTEEYIKLNKLLTEEYALRLRIEEAKLKRYTANDSEKESVTVLEKQLQKQLEINQAKKNSITTGLKDSGLESQQKITDLADRELKLKSELAIKEAQIASSRKIVNEKAVYDLEMFKRSMNVQMDSTQRRYGYASGTTDELNKYKSVLSGLTVENGKWYRSVEQADGSMKKQAVTAQQLRMQFREMNNTIQSNIGVVDRLKKSFVTFGQYFLGGGLVMQGVRQIREMFSYITEMDKYLTNVRLITGKTAESVSELTQEYIKLGKELGATSQTVAEIAEGFYRQGKSAEDTRELIKATTMMAQLAGTGTSESTEYLTSIMNSYKLNVSDMTDVVSKLVSVDNAAATSVSEVALALSKVSSVAQSTGVSLDTLTGYIATVSSTTRQEAESIGQAFKTIFTRMSDIKIGDYLDDGIGEADVLKVLDSVGVKLKENETTYRDFEDVLADLSSKWSGLNDVQVKAISKTIAGTRQANVFMALMQNMSKAQELSAISANSAGLAQERFGVYLESTESKINQFKTSLSEMYSQLMSSNTINNFLDFGNGVIQLITNLGGLNNVLLATIGYVIILKNEVIKTIAINAVSKIQSLLVPLKLLSDGITRIPNAMIQAARHGASFTETLNAGRTAMTRMVAGTNALINVLGIATIAFAAYQAYQARQQRLHDEYISSLQEKISKSKEELDSIKDLKSQYEELYKTTNRTEEQNKKLLDIQNKLTTSLDLQKGSIDATKQSWDELSKSIDKATRKKLEDQLQSQTQLVKEAQDDLANEMTNNNLKGRLVFDSDMLGDKDLAKQMQGVAKQVNDTLGKEVVKLSKSSTGIELFNIENEKEYYNVMMEIQKVAQDGSHQEFWNSKNFDSINQELLRMEALTNNLDEKSKEVFDIKVKLDLPNLLDTLDISDVDNITQEQTDALKKSFTDTFSEIGKQQNADYIQYFYGMVDAIRANKVAMDDLNGSQGDTSDSWATISETFKSLTTETDILQTSLNQLTSGDLTGFQKGLEDLAKAYPQLADSMGSTEEAIVGITREINNQKISNYADSVKELTGTIEKLKDGQILSGEEITELTTKYPQLQSAITNVNGVYSIELGALEGLTTSMRTNTKETIEGELKKTKVVLEETKTRIQARIEEQIANSKFSGFNYDEEEDDSLQTLYKKQGEYLEMEKSLQEQLSSIDMLGQQGSSSKSSKSSKSYIEQGFQDQIDLVKSKREELVDEISKLQSQIEIATTKQGGSSAYVQKLRDQLNKLKEDEKSLIQSSADELRKIRDDYFTNLTKGNDLFKGLKAEDLNDTVLAQVSRQMEKTIQGLGSSDAANKLELNKSRIEEMAQSVIAVNEELKTLGDDFYSNKMDILDEYISRIQDAISAQEDIVSNNESEINLKMSVLDETDEGYIQGVMQLQQQLIDDKLALQKTYETEYKKVLNILGNSEVDVCKEIKDKWNTTQNEILELRKQSNEKYIAYINGQSNAITTSRDIVVEMYKDIDDRAKDTLNKQRDALEEEADLRKEALESRKDELSAIKDEYDYQNKINDLRQSLSDTMSDLNALEFDDSADAIQSKIELMSKAQDEQQALADAEFNKAIEDAQAVIDDAITAIDNQTKVQVALLEAQLESLNRTDKDYQNMANQAMQTDMGKLKEQVLVWNSEHGDGLTATVQKAFDNVANVMQSLSEAGMTISEALNNFATLVYEKEKENSSFGTTLFDGTTLSGSGSEYLNKSLSTNNIGLSNVVNTVITGMKNILDDMNATPKNVTVSPQFNVYAEGNVDNATLNEAKRWFTTSIPRVIESAIEPFLKVSVRNIAGTTK